MEIGAGQARVGCRLRTAESPPAMEHSGWLLGAPSYFVPRDREWENKNGQWSVNSLNVELRESHEQNAALFPSII